MHAVSTFMTFNRYRSSLSSKTVRKILWWKISRFEDVLFLYRFFLFHPQAVEKIFALWIRKRGWWGMGRPKQQQRKEFLCDVAIKWHLKNFKLNSSSYHVVYYSDSIHVKRTVMKYEWFTIVIGAQCTQSTPKNSILIYV